MDVTDLFTLSSSSSFASLLESEEDFTFGAKTTPFLPPATTTTTAHHATPTYSLPDWMEGRDIIGLPDTFQDLSLPLSPKDHYPLKLEDEVEDDYYTTIKPEDMLVPLSELLPPHTPPTPPLPSTPPATPPPAPATPPPAPATPPPAPATPVAPLRKIIICRKVTTAAPKARPIQVNYQVIPVKPKVMSASLRPLHTAPHTTMPLGKSHQIQVAMPFGKNHQSQVAMPLGKNHEHQVAMSFGKNHQSQVAMPLESRVSAMPLAMPLKAQVPLGCDAEELINEMVQMIGGGSSGLQDLGSESFESLESSGMESLEANLDDLLSQLEASESDTIMLDPHAFTQTSRPASQPYPSVLPASQTSLSLPASQTYPSVLPTSQTSLLLPASQTTTLFPASQTSTSLLPASQTYPSVLPASKTYPSIPASPTATSFPASQTTYSTLLPSQTSLSVPISQLSPISLPSLSPISQPTQASSYISLAPASVLPSEPVPTCILSPPQSEYSISTSLISPHSKPSVLPSESSITACIPSPLPSETLYPVSPLSLPSPVPSVSSLPSPVPSISFLPSPIPSSTSLSPPHSCTSPTPFSDSPIPFSESPIPFSESPIPFSVSTFDLEDEWSPAEETLSYAKAQRKPKASKTSSRKTPYPTDRKQRKKEQNKQAALRYRQKRKVEEDDMTGKVEAEVERGRKLKAEYSGLKQELSYLKKIMREVFVARGLLSEEALKKAALEKRKSKKEDPQSRSSKKQRTAKEEL